MARKPLATTTLFSTKEPPSNPIPTAKVAAVGTFSIISMDFAHSPAGRVTFPLIFATMGAGGGGYGTDEPRKDWPIHCRTA